MLKAHSWLSVTVRRRSRRAKISVKAREDALAERDLLDAIHKFDSTLARFDAYEAERTKDPEDDLLSAPGDDDGELEAPSEEPRSPVSVEDD